MSERPCAAGFTLLELLMVIAIVAILTAVVLPWADSASHQNLESAARTVATDFAYARSLAVTNNSNYRVTFDVDENKYTLEHSGSNSALDALPDSVFRDSDDPPDQHTVDLANLPGIGESVKLAGVFHVGTTTEPATSIEFGPLGETTQTGYSVVVLTLGSGFQKQQAFVLVNPITGLATVYPGGRDLPSDLLPASVETITDSL